MEKYDLIIPSGFSCRPAFHLRRNNLRKCSYPFDWNICNLEDQMRLFKNNFNGFYDDYEILPISESVDGVHYAVLDKKYNIKSVHFIPIESDIDKSIDDFKQLMKKRYDRLIKDINNAKSILLVSNEQLDLEKAKKLLLDFSKTYPNKKITYVIAINEECELEKQEYIIDSNLKIVMYKFDDIYEPIGDYVDNLHEFLGNFKKWDLILSNYGIN